MLNLMALETGESARQTRETGREDIAYFLPCRTTRVSYNLLQSLFLLCEVEHEGFALPYLPWCSELSWRIGELVCLWKITRELYATYSRVEI